MRLSIKVCLTGLLTALQLASCKQRNDDQELKDVTEYNVSCESDWACGDETMARGHVNSNRMFKSDADCKADLLKQLDGSKKCDDNKYSLLDFKSQIKDVKLATKPTVLTALSIISQTNKDEVDFASRGHKYAAAGIWKNDNSYYLFGKNIVLLIDAATGKIVKKVGFKYDEDARARFIELFGKQAEAEGTEANITLAEIYANEARNVVFFNYGNNKNVWFALYTETGRVSLIPDPAGPKVKFIYGTYIPKGQDDYAITKDLLIRSKVTQSTDLGGPSHWSVELIKKEADSTEKSLKHMSLDRSNMIDFGERMLLSPDGLSLLAVGYDGQSSVIALGAGIK